MRAAPYRRVSDPSQVEGHSLDAQERAANEYCEKRGWTSVADYCEAGKSAHVDTIEGRPVFRQLLDDASKGLFDVVVVHTLDRWSRNLKVMLEAFAILGENGVGLVSITEDIDYSTPHGRFTMQTLGSVNELSSGLLAVHTRKGISERARKGFHLGSVPFGYESCWESKGGERRLRCKPEHPGSIHVQPREGPAVKELFRRYSSGMVTLATLAGRLNDQGFRTRNTKKLPDGGGGSVAGPRLFTSASVRHILHNAIYCGNVRHRDELLPGVHEEPELWTEPDPATPSSAGIPAQGPDPVRPLPHAHVGPDLRQRSALLQRAEGFSRSRVLCREKRVDALRGTR